jgi:hypothetical protein
MGEEGVVRRRSLNMVDVLRHSSANSKPPPPPPSLSSITYLWFAASSFKRGIALVCCPCADSCP